MSTVEEFIKVRKSIEALATKITLCLERKAFQDARQSLDEANRLLDSLKTMVANDVQVIVAGRLTRQLTDLGTKTETAAAKPPTRKKATGKKVERKKPENNVPKTSSARVVEEEPEIVVYERP